MAESIEDECDETCPAEAPPEAGLADPLEMLELADESPEKVELVNLRYFGGLSHQEAAKALGISRATADRYWAYAKVFLHCEMEDAEKP